MPQISVAEQGVIKKKNKKACKTLCAGKIYFAHVMFVLWKTTPAI